MSVKLNLSESQSWKKPGRIDKDAGVIYGVKVGGLESGNGNDYTVQTYRESLHLFEGRKVNLNHKKRSEKNEDRTILDRFGRLKDARVGEDGLYADLHYNPKHPLAESILWFAENDPESLGLSQYGSGVGRKKANGRYQVESITSVMSVDLVADPATTKSLFESQEPDMAEEAEKPDTQDTPDHEAAMGDAFAQGVMAAVKDPKLDIAGKLKRIKDILQAQDKLMGKEDAPEDKAPDEDESEDKSDEGEVEESQKPDPELLQLRREKNIRVLCESLKYTPDQAMMDVLTSVGDDAKVKALVEKEAAKAKLSGKAKSPKSASSVGLRESVSGVVTANGKELATSLRRMK